MKIPILSPNLFDTAKIREVMDIGFCYVDVAEENVIAEIKNMIEISRQLFAKSPDDKAKWQIQKELKSGERYRGYALRTQPNNDFSIEQFFFDPEFPFGPYDKYSSSIKAIHSYYFDIFIPLIRAIFKALNIDTNDFEKATLKPHCNLVFQHLPRVNENKKIIRFNAHKDFGMVTILFFREPGLEINYRGSWYPVPYRERSLVVNLGNALELMTNGACHSALHRVTNASDDRISMVYFVNPNYQSEVINYITRELLAPSGKLFIKQQFTDYYDQDY